MSIVKDMIYLHLRHVLSVGEPLNPEVIQMGNAKYSTNEFMIHGG